MGQACGAGRQNDYGSLQRQKREEISEEMRCAFLLFSLVNVTSPASPGQPGQQGKVDVEAKFGKRHGSPEET